MMKTMGASMMMVLGMLATAQAGENFACNMNAMTKQERATHEKLARKVFAAVEENRELSNGYAFRLPAGNLVDVASWASLERKCCPFLTFEIEVPRDQGPVWLRVTGSDGVKAFLADELGLSGR